MSAAKKPNVMRIERVTLLEIDIEAERQRLARNFKGAELALLSGLLDSFVALELDKTHETLRSMGREQLEYVHPVIFEVMKDRVQRNTVLTEVEGLQVKFSDMQKMMGGTSGPCSHEGLAYPKFKVEERVF